jgi:hypothetical protein
MSVFTNPASSSKEQASAYIAAVLDLVGPRDPRELLEHTPKELRQVIDGLDDQQVNTPEVPGKWAIKHVIQHLADSELVWGYRLRMVLAQDRPLLTGYDQDLWAAHLRYDEVDVRHALEDFTVLRRANLRLLARVPGEDWLRVGVHVERGEESIDHMMRLYAGHDLLHLRQLDRIRQSLAVAPEPMA